MKFMKLGSKPDQFQTEGDNIRYVATELETDIVINVGVVKFYLHKFPVLSKSYRLQMLVATTNDENTDEINIDGIPGGPAAFEVCAKFCYNMTVTLNAYNVVAARCAAEYLEMYESVEKGNLIYKIEVFLASSILRSRKDSIIVLQTARAFLPWSEELKIVIDSMTSLLPTEKKSVSVSFLIRWLQMAIALECGDTVRSELKRRISVQLEEATVGDLLISDTKTRFDVDLVHDLVYHFMIHQKKRFQELCPVFASDDSKVKVARIVDGYLAEVSRDPTLLLSKFVSLAELVSGFPRPSHDGIYRAIDMYLKEHPWITKCERKRICKLMDCKKLSAEACMHAVQNERLPLRVVVQVLFFEQVRATSSSGDLAGPLKAKLHTVRSYGSSTTATSNTDEDWDAAPSAKELRALKCGLDHPNDMKTDAEKVSKKIYSKLRSSNSSTDTSGSPSSSNAGEMKPISCKSKRESSRGLVPW